MCRKKHKKKWKKSYENRIVWNNILRADNKCTIHIIHKKQQFMENDKIIIEMYEKSMVEYNKSR